MKLDGYIRVSRVAGRGGESYITEDQQRERITAFAKVMGADIARWHVDRDKSGGKLSRPGLDLALSRIERGKTEGLIVAKIDRFARVQEAAGTVKRIIEMRGTFASAEDRIDPTTPMGKAMLGVILVFAEMELDRITDNWADARRRAVEDRGIHFSARTPTGYQRQVIGTDAKGNNKLGRLEPNADAEHISAIFKMRAAGATWRELADYLTANAVMSPYGTKDWTASAARKIVENKVYLGIAKSGSFTNESAHEALTDPDTFAGCQSVRAKPFTDRAGTHLLTGGLLTCASCGMNLKPSSGRGGRDYRCGNRDCEARAAIKADWIEGYMLELFWMAAGGIVAKGGPTNDALRAAQAALGAARDRLAQVESEDAQDAFAGRWIEVVRERREAVKAAQDELEHQRELAGIADLPDRQWLVDHWSGLDVAERRRYLRTIFKTVKLTRGRQPVDGRTELVLRAGELPPTAERLPDGTVRILDGWQCEAYYHDRAAVAEELEADLHRRDPRRSWQAA